MKKLFGTVLIFAVAAIWPLSAQTPGDNGQGQLLTAVKEIQAQQAQIADNQTKIESKIAELTEIIRVARIFTGRTGGANKPPP